MIQPTCPKAESDHHLRENYSQERRKQNLGPCESVIDPVASILGFTRKKDSWKEVLQVKKPRTNSSAAQGSTLYGM